MNLQRPTPLFFLSGLEATSSLLNRLLNGEVRAVVTLNRRFLLIDRTVVYTLHTSAAKN
jgi:hypothetical protein